MSRISEVTDGLTEEGVALVLKFATDVQVRRPLWEFAPEHRPSVLRERRVRGFDFDPEPIGDAEYS